MQNDFNRFRDVFFEEAAEHVAVMEEGLLRLEAVPGDSELLHGVFRAVHSIKGSGGMLGFDDVVRYAHSLESVLDRLRNEEMEVTPALSGLLLRASDALKEAVAAARSGEAPPAANDGILAEIEETLTAGSAPVGTVYRVHFQPSPELFATGMDPLLALRELAGLGELLEAKADLDRLPTLAALDPDTCYLGWECRLRTMREAEELREVFAFVEDGAVITVEREAERERAGAAGSAPPARRHAPAIESSTVRVATGKVDKLVDLVGELVIAQSMAGQILSDFSLARLGELLEAFTTLERNTRELQERVMAVRMQPIGGVFGRFSRLVRDLAAETGKKIVLETSGEDTELDKSVIERLADPLTHLVRNAVDHGIDLPAERERAGKPEQGVVRLRAFHENGSVVVEVADDGRGLDAGRIRAKAAEVGLIGPADQLSEEETRSLIFEPGFSTAERVSDLSGRGVGMDVVKRNVEALNGSVQVSTEAGKGTTFRVRLPLTLAILDGLLIKVGAEAYVLPLTSIVETIRPRREEVKTLAGKGEVVMVRQEALPLTRLHGLFRGARRRARPGGRRRRYRRARRTADGSAGGRVARPTAGGGQESRSEFPKSGWRHGGDDPGRRPCRPHPGRSGHRADDRRPGPLGPPGGGSESRSFE